MGGELIARIVAGCDGDCLRSDELAAFNVTRRIANHKDVLRGELFAVLLEGART